MPNGWSFNWERESLETRCVESLHVVYVCLSLLSLIDAKDSSSVRKGLMTNWPHHSSTSYGEPVSERTDTDTDTRMGRE
jgi:hypothetical protein